jgi:hypothetical protein
MNGLRFTKRQRRGTNPDLDELNMSDSEIAVRSGSGTGPSGIQERQADLTRINASPSVLSTAEPPARPAASAARNEPLA